MNQELRHRLDDIIADYGYQSTLQQLAWMVYDHLQKTNPNDSHTALNSIGIAVDMVRRNE